jgi:hypothetical protein
MKMTDKTTVDINFLYATITVIIAVVGCIFAVKQNRKQNEEHIEKKIKEANVESDEKTKLKLENESLKREKLEGDFKNIVNDSLIDKKALRDVTNSVSNLNKRDVVHEENIKAMKDDIKEIKDDSKSTTIKIFEKLDTMSECMTEIKVQIAEK